MTKHRLELSLAKSIKSLFARSYRPYAFGAFGKPTMQYIFSALAANRVVCAFDADGTLAGAALFAITRANSIHQDFSRRECAISRGSLYVKHLAVAPGDVAQVIGLLVEKLFCRANGAPVWLEIHEENRSMRREIEERLGFSYVMTKIMAASDIRGLYCQSPTAVKLASLPRSDIPSLKCLQSGFLSPREMTDILKELNKYASGRQAWAQHYSHYNKRKSWTAFSLRGYCAGDAGFVAKPTEMSKQWKLENPKLLENVCENTIAARYFPMTLRVVRRIPGAKERVRFMRLEPAGGELGRHADITDREAGTQDGCVVRLHIPLITHQEVLFEGWDLRGEHQEMHFGAGGLYYLDQRKAHRVINRSPVERIHLVVDTYSSRALRDLMR